MPPPIKFDKETVAQAAFELVRQKGRAGLTARHVAKRLGSSIAPVYSVFRSMDGLEREVNERALQLLLDYMARRYTDQVFLNMGVGLCVFAREERRLFRALFLESGHIRATIERLLKRLNQDLAQVPYFAALPEAARHALLTKMWTFTHGLATLICLGASEEEGDEFIIRSLLDVGQVVVDATMAEYRREKAPEKNPALSVRKETRNGKVKASH